MLDVLDWPELRSLFEEHNRRAGQLRRHSQALGFAVVCSAALGVAIAAASPLLAGTEFGPFPAELVAASLSAVLTLASGIAGFWLWGGARVRSRWIIHRYWTERLRQLYFQALVADLPAAAAAMRSKSALRAWHRTRDGLLKDFAREMQDPAYQIQITREDLVDSMFWVLPDIAHTTEASLPASSSELNRLLRYLRRRRFGIQEEYTKKKLQQNLSSPRVRAVATRIASDILSALMVLLALAVAILLLSGAQTTDLPIKTCLAAGGIVGALIAGLRAFDEGVRNRGDAERYEWYLAAVRDLAARFDTGDDSEKVRALAQLERMAYREMRGFVEAHLTARFIP